jgi:FkbM family methyltransferase
LNNTGSFEEHGVFEGRPRALNLFSKALFSKAAKLQRLVARVDSWPRALADHLRLSRGTYICRLRDGSVMEIRGHTDDRHVLFEIFVENIYPVRVKPGDTVIDVGAQIGCYTVRTATQGARVYAFEPFPANFAALQRNIALNDLAEVKAFPHAVGAESGPRTMFVPDEGGHTGRYSLFPGRGSQTISVACISLDDIVRENRLQRVDVLKIDCQGSEYEILYAASEDTLARIRCILIECEIFDRADWSVSSLESYLRRNGFTVNSRDRLLHAQRGSGVAA